MPKSRSASESMEKVVQGLMMIWSPFLYATDSCCWLLSENSLTLNSQEVWNCVLKSFCWFERWLLWWQGELCSSLLKGLKSMCLRSFRGVIACLWGKEKGKLLTGFWISGWHLGRGGGGVATHLWSYEEKEYAAFVNISGERCLLNLFPWNKIWTRLYIFLKSKYE